MGITCREIMKIPIMDQIPLLAGREGLNRQVSWVYLLDNPRYIDWLRGGELVIMTGSEHFPQGDDLIELMDQLDEKQISGIIVNLSFYINTVPREMIHYANQLELPLFRMPAEMRIVEVSQEIGYAIFQKSLAGNEVGNAILQIYYGSRISANRVANLEKAGFQTGNHYRAIVFADGEKYQTALEESLSASLCTNTLLTAVDEADLFLLLPEKIAGKGLMDAAFLENVLRKADTEKLTVGTGGLFTDLREMRRSIDEARLAVRYAQGQAGVFWYDDLLEIRVMQNFKDAKEVHDIVYKILSPLLTEDNQPLLKTLQIYINCDFNAEQAAEKLYIHKNTMYGRLRKIENLLDVDLKSHRSLFRIMFALEYLRFDANRM